MRDVAFARWDPIRDLLAIQQRLDRFAPGPVAWKPPVDLLETPDAYVITAELPGVNRDDINVEVVDGELRLAATRKHTDGDREESFSFSRSVTLPDTVQADQVSAAYENGVLTVTLPKREEAKPKKVAIAVK